MINKQPPPIPRFHFLIKGEGCRLRETALKINVTPSAIFLNLGAAVAAAAANGHSKKKKAADSDEEDDPFVVSDSDSEG